MTLTNHQLAASLDEALGLHMAWLRKIFRCVLLDTMPGADMVAEDAHERCPFSAWLGRAMPMLRALDDQRAETLRLLHRQLHDDVRNFCCKLSSGQALQPEDIDAVEISHDRVVNLLTNLKSQAVVLSASIDPLTGLATRALMAMDYLHLQKQCARHDARLAVVLVDVDHFKSINDIYGHAGGDQALCQMAHTLRDVLRGNDRIYRYGGEEFVAFCEVHTAADADVLSRRILEAVRAIQVDIGNTPAQLTATLGCTIAEPDEPLEDVIERADRAMYRGKRAGRDRAVIAAPD